MGVQSELRAFRVTSAPRLDVARPTLDVLAQPVVVDRSFVSATGGLDGGDALLHTLVQLAKELGLETVVEGIETVDQLNFLQEQHCDTGQGFLIANPMSADAIMDFVHSARLGSGVSETNQVVAT
jgi:sensor c-di-GMP phosphodiesterase-like protein